MTARMSRPEAVTLCRLAKAACPQQAFDEYTPDAWYELLGDLSFGDCKEALFDVVKRQPFVSPAEIRGQVKRIRFKRIDAFGPFDPPAELGDRTDDYRKWIAEMYRQIGDGTLTREQYDAQRLELPKRDMRAIEGTFRHVDEEPA